MAKKKQPTKIPSENPSSSKKPSDLASLAKKPVEVASTSKKPLKDVTAAKNKKQPEPVIIPPSESSSEEVEETESEGEEEEGPSKDSGKNPVTPSASAPAPVVAATANQSSDSESESETEGESDSETEAATTETAPPATATVTAAASASPNKKRQSEGAASTEVEASKRAKTESGTASKGLFQRIWSEEDEIVLLQGILDFRSSTGKSHSDDLAGFFESVKDSISFEVKSVSQCSNKIWSLRKKYVGKWKNGVEPSFTKPHDKRCLELAKMVWGTTSDLDSTDVMKSKKKTEVEDVEADWFEKSFLVGSITNLGVFLDEAYVREKWSTVPVEAKKKMLEKWKSLEAIKLQWVLLKADLMNDACSWIAKSD